MKSVSARRAEVAVLLARFAAWVAHRGGRVVEARRWTWATSRGGCARTFAIPTATTPSCMCCRPADLQEHAVRAAVANDGEAGPPDRPARCGDVRCGVYRLQVVGGITDAEAAWRGAFAHGSPTRAGTSALRSARPGPEAALASGGVQPVGTGVSAKAREVRGADRVVVRDGGEAIGALLRPRMGAQDTRLVWGGAPDAS